MPDEQNMVNLINDRILKITKDLNNMPTQAKLLRLCGAGELAMILEGAGHKPYTSSHDLAEMVAQIVTVEQLNHAGRN